MSAIASERLGDAESGPENEVLRPEVLQEILVQFRAELTKATDQSSAMGTHHENRFDELESELRNLTNAIAKGKGSTSALLEAIAEREREIKELKRAMKTEEQRRPEKVLEGLDEFVLNRVTRIRELLQTDVVRAKQELGNHVSELIMHPQPDTGSYVVEGEWDLLGARLPGGQTTSRTDGLYVGMVPGGGVEPP